VAPSGVTCAPLPGFPGYYAGEDGSIWSTKSGEWKSRKLTPNRSQGGRLFICLAGPDGNRVRWVHRLILEAFVGPCPSGMECCHGPGGKLDNRLSNLRWDTRAANFADLYLHTGGNTGTRGEKNCNAVLTENEVREIMRLALEGCGPAEIGRRLNRPKATVWNVLGGKNWNHVTGLPRLPGWRGKNPSHRPRQEPSPTLCAIPQCGREFIPAVGGRPQKYCSVACRRNAAARKPRK
jgi:hypothetical protein